MSSLKEKLQKQQEEANEYAQRIKPSSYGKEFEYFLNLQSTKMKTKFGLKTVGDFLQQYNKKHNTENMVAFDQTNLTNILGHNLLLQDVKELHLVNIDQSDMVYIHVFGKKDIQTFYLNKEQTTVKDVIDTFNQNTTEKLNINTDKYGIGDRLEPGFQINDNMQNTKISEYVKYDEGLIQQLQY